MILALPDQSLEERREAAVRRLLPYMRRIAWHVARRYGQDVDEMYSCCLFGLWIAALRTRDLSFGRSFESYAKAWADGYARRWIHKQWSLRNWRPNQRDRGTISFEDFRLGGELVVFTPPSEDLAAPLEDLHLLTAVSSLLTEHQRLVIWVRYWRGATLQEAADALGTTHAAVSDAEQRALGRLRDALGLKVGPKDAEKSQTSPHPRHVIERLPDGRKVCRSCGIPKELEEFPKGSGWKDGRRSDCRECKNAKQRQASLDYYYKRKAERERNKQIEPNVRLCARRRLCLAYPQLGEPARLSGGNPNPLCEQCQRARREVIA